MRRPCLAALVLLIALPMEAGPLRGQTATAPSTTAEIDALYPDLAALYQDLHRNPELGFQETRTAATLAARLRSLGYEVTTGVGGTGIVALLRNGAGPTAMPRTLPNPYRLVEGWPTLPKSMNGGRWGELITAALNDWLPSR